jgi:hypothetical protein
MSRFLVRQCERLQETRIPGMLIIDSKTLV